MRYSSVTMHGGVQQAAGSCLRGSGVLGSVSMCMAPRIVQTHRKRDCQTDALACQISMRQSA
jgi:hypothetical protein